MIFSLLMLSLTAFLGCAVVTPMLEKPQQNLQLQMSVVDATYGNVIKSQMGYSYTYESADYVLYAYDFDARFIDILYDNERSFVDVYYYNNTLQVDYYEDFSDYISSDGVYVASQVPLHLLMDIEQDYFYVIPLYRPRVIDLGDESYTCDTIEFYLETDWGQSQINEGLNARNVVFDTYTSNSFAELSLGTYGRFNVNGIPSSYPTNPNFNYDNLKFAPYAFNYYADSQLGHLSNFRMYWALIGNLDYTIDYYYQYGYNNGYINGYNSGFDAGVSTSNNTIYQQGYNQGYVDGLALAQQGGFTSLFGAIADTPVMFMRSMFSFDLFGMNVFIIIMSLLTGIVVIYVIKKVIH